jgi:hypothetical protein
MQVTKGSLVFLEIWRGIFHATGVVLIIGAIAFAMAFVGMQCEVPWLGHLLGQDGISLYGGRFILDRAQSNLYLGCIFLVFPVIGWAGFHFHDFAINFLLRVYSKLKWD